MMRDTEEFHEVQDSTLANKALQLTSLSVSSLPLALAAERQYVGRTGLRNEVARVQNDF